jgi:hypothetical protein
MFKREIQVKLIDETTNLEKLEAGVSQGSVSGHVLYLIYTSNLPTSDNTTAASVSGHVLYLIYTNNLPTSDNTTAASVSGHVLYVIYKNNLPTSDNTTAATFADDRAILARHEEPAIASLKLQPTINEINVWAKKWRIKINRSKSTHISFTLRNQICSTVQMDNVALPQKTK